MKSYPDMLSWSEVGARWPDASVAWDALGAPFDAGMVIDHETLVAVHPHCAHALSLTQWVSRDVCGCLVWDSAWISFAERRQRAQVAQLHDDLENGRVTLPRGPSTRSALAFISSGRSGKSAYMRALVEARVLDGDRVAVVTPSGVVDGREWLARFRRQQQRPRFAVLRRQLAAQLLQSS